MKTKKNYNFPDVDMLISGQTVLGNLKINLSELAALRTDWTLEYVDKFILRIKNAMETQLGIDVRKNLRKATVDSTSIKVVAKKNLSLFKTQIEKDFKKNPARKNEILLTLGFTKLLKDVQRDKNQSLITLLYTFKTNMTDALRTEITSKGMNGALIDSIIAYTENFTTANIEQESSKSSTKGIKVEVNESFNDIYSEIIGICKTAATYYRNNPVKRENFIFSKIISHVRATRKAEEKPVSTNTVKSEVVAA